MKLMEEFLNISLKNVKRRKLRSWLTIVGIIISIATIFMLVSVSLGLNAAVQEQFRQLGTDKFFIQPKGQIAGPGTAGSVNLTDDDINAIKKVAGVKDVATFSIKTVKVEAHDNVRFVYIMGVNLDSSFKILQESGFLKVEDGRMLSQGDSKKAMIGSQYKLNDILGEPIEVGDTLTLNDEHRVRVKAVLETVGNPSDDKNLYIPLDDFEEMFPDKINNYDQLIVQIEQGRNITDIAEKVDKQLVYSRDLDRDNKDFTILTPEEFLAAFGTILNILTAFLLGIAAISLVVGAIGIANTMYTAVVERTKEIGVMKAVGAKNSDIIQMFTIESGLIGLIGGLGGVILGFLVAQLIGFIAVSVLSTSLLQVATPLYLFAGCLIFSFVIGAISGLVPAFQASRIKPVVALRYE